MLVEFLRNLIQVGIINPPEMPDCKTEQLVRELEREGYQDMKVIPSDLQKKIRTKVFTDRWNDLTSREWRCMPSCLWGEEPYLADHEIIFEKMYAHYNRSNTGMRKINRLIGTYFYYYEPERKNLHKLGDVIVRLIKHNDQAQKEWQDKIFLFDPSKAHVFLAEALSDYPIHHVLNAIYPRCTNYRIILCNSIHHVLNAIYPKWEKGNAVPFFATTFKELCRKSLLVEKSDEKHDNLLEKIMNWAIHEDELRYPTHKVELANALLRPWYDYDREDDFTNRIESFMLKHYGDPRLQPEKWIGVDDEAQNVIRQWLSKRSLEQFFTVVDQVAEQSHWSYRKQFWHCYLKHDMEVWVVFADQCQSYSQQIFGEELKYGKFSSGSHESNHAVLIMKIDRLIITDWSHRGACRMYSINDRLCPKMYANSYDADELRNIKQGEEGWFRHHNSERDFYLWQPNFAEQIYRKTGIRISENEYRLET